MGFAETLADSLSKLTQNKKALAVLGLIVLAALVYFFVLPNANLSGETGAQVKAIFTVTTSTGNPLNNVEVSYTSLAGDWKQGHTDSAGKIVLAAKANSIIKIKINEMELDGKQFQLFEQDFAIGETDLTQTIAILEKFLETRTKSILFQDSQGLITGKNIQATFSCSNTTIAPFRASDEDQDGVMEIETPLNCGNLSVQVNSDDFEESNANFSETETEKIINLQERTVPNGFIDVSVLDGSGNLVTDTSFTVRAQKTTGENYSETTGEYGTVRMEIAPGRYTVSVEDTTDKYGSSNVEGIQVNSGQRTPVELRVSKNLLGRIKVRVLDKANQSNVIGAIVVLKDAREGTVLSEKTITATQTQVEFPITDQKEYLIGAKKIGGVNEGYFPAEISTTNANADLTLRLDKITSLNSGKTKVHVQDEANDKVVNARVMFRKKSNGAIVEVSDASAVDNQKVTDVNGNVEFILGSLTEEVFAFAVKSRSQGGTAADSKEIKLETINEFTVTMQVGTAGLNIRAVKFEDNLTINDGRAKYEVFTWNGRSVLQGERPLVTGEDSIEVKADTKIYVRISHPDYMTWQSQVIDLWAEEEYAVTGVMKPQFFGKGDQRGPEIVLEGIFDEFGQESVTQLLAGQNYEARLKVTYPAGQDLRNGGIHFRVGNTDRIENDALYVIFDKINAGGNPIVKRYTTYNQNTGWDGETETLSNAKWVNISWIDVEPIEYSVGIGIHVNAEAELENLDLFYRAWGANTSNSYLRDPLDNVLALAPSAAELVNEPYAQTYTAQFKEGEDSACDSTTNNFCWSGEQLKGYIPGIGADLIFPVTQGYNVRNFSNYNLKFNLRNVSRTEYENMRLLVEEINNQNQSVLEVGSLELVNADGQDSRINSSDKKSVTASALGEFTINKQIQGMLSFKPVKAKATTLKITLFGNDQIVFEKIIALRVLSEKELSIEKIAPLGEVLPAYSDTQLQLQIKGIEPQTRGSSEQTREFNLDGVRVEVRTLLPGELNPTLISNGTQISGTNPNLTGQVLFTIPGLPPNAQVIVSAIKEGYVEGELVLNTDTNVVDFLPEEIQFMNLNTRTRTDESQTFSLHNRAGANIRIQNLRFGEIQRATPGIFDTGRMQALLETQSQDEALQIISVDGTQNFTALAALTRDAEMRMQESTETFTTQLTGLAFLDGVNNAYAFQIPVQGSVQFAGRPASGCIVLNGNKIPVWDIVTKDIEEVTEFKLTNNCTLNDVPVELDGLKVTLNWTEGPTAGGTATLTMTGPNSEGSIIPLRNGQTNTLLEKIRTDQDYSLQLGFRPNAEFIGQKVGFTITIKGFISNPETNAEQPLIGSTPENITVKAYIVNLEQCINIDTTNPEIASDTEEIRFKVSLVPDCAQARITLDFCKNDPGCSGGTSEGRIAIASPQNQRVTLFGTGASAESEVVVERRDLAGVYTIPIKAKSSIESGPGQEIKRLDVKVQPNSSEQITLSNYAFQIIGPQAQDTAILTNKNIFERVTIQTNKCVADHIDEENENWIGVGVGAGAGAAAFAVPILYLAATVATIPVAGWVAAGILATSALVITIIMWPDCEEEFVTMARIVPVTQIGSGNLDNSDLTEHTFTELSNSEWDIANIPVSLGRKEIDLKQDGAETGSALKITNTTGVSSVKDEFGILKLKYAERIYAGDLAHSPEAQGEYDLYCEEDENDEEAFADEITPQEFAAGKVSFSNGDCSGRITKEREVKYHIKLATKPKPAERPSFRDTETCMRGVIQGDTGTNASMPKVKFDWTWTGNTAIEANTCDASNENAVYCDATQFAIMVNKKMNALKTFLEQNETSLNCPANPITGAIADAAAGAQPNNLEIAVGNIGVKIVETQITETTAVITATVENKTTQAQTAQIQFSAITLQDRSRDQSAIVPITVPANGTLTSNTTFYNLSPGKVYAFGAGVKESTPGIANNRSASQIFQIEGESGIAEECILPYTTKEAAGVPIISVFAVNSSTVQWTNEIPDIQTLNKTVSFEALLMKDNPNTDFQSDFVETYGLDSVIDTPDWFKQSEDGLKEIFGDSTVFKFKGKYTDTSNIGVPGKYKVNLEIDFGNKEWKFFRNGASNVNINAVFDRIQNPVPDHPFYYLPFDGKVGLNSADGRQGYGVNYENEGQEIYVIAGTGDIETLKTTPINSSNPLVTFKVKQEESLQKMNNDIIENRGKVMEIERNEDGTQARIQFTPNNPHAILLKMNQTETSDDPYRANYQLMDSGNQIQNIGNVLTYWTGAGRCLDFTGISVSNVFNNTQDSRDPASNTYYQEWPQIDKTGNVFLKTVVYTPFNETYSFRTQGEGNNKPKVLNAGHTGFQDQPLSLANRTTQIGSISQVFELVQTGEMCMINDGTKILFYWDEKKVYDQARITALEQTMNTAPDNSEFKCIAE
ncbi:MAG: carboxypeptidase-like regulatory domain-containing protein [Candidatus Diapherotrites archaeon]|nr:carboxypeptidase-like regulatory domain-containing protein [Candidatus Diapherotrites archaeon]